MECQAEKNTKVKSRLSGEKRQCCMNDGSPGIIIDSNSTHTYQTGQFHIPLDELLKISHISDMSCLVQKSMVPITESIKSNLSHVRFQGSL